MTMPVGMEKDRQDMGAMLLGSREGGGKGRMDGKTGWHTGPGDGDEGTQEKPDTRYIIVFISVYSIHLSHIWGDI